MPRPGISRVRHCRKHLERGFLLRACKASSCRLDESRRPARALRWHWSAMLGRACLPITARGSTASPILPVSSPTQLSGRGVSRNSSPVLSLCDVAGDLSNSLIGCGWLARPAPLAILLRRGRKRSGEKGSGGKLACAEIELILAAQSEPKPIASACRWPCKRATLHSYRLEEWAARSCTGVVR